MFKATVTAVARLPRARAGPAEPDTDTVIGGPGITGTVIVTVMVTASPGPGRRANPGTVTSPPAAAATRSPAEVQVQVPG